MFLRRVYSSLAVNVLTSSYENFWNPNFATNHFLMSVRHHPDGFWHNFFCIGGLLTRSLPMEYQKRGFFQLKFFMKPSNPVWRFDAVETSQNALFRRILIKIWCSFRKCDWFCPKRTGTWSKSFIFQVR